MARNSIDVAAVPETVWEVLAYSEWVVGTKNVARVDANCPLSVADHTVVIEADAPRTLVLRAEFRPVGSFLIHLELHPVGSGTRIIMAEGPVARVADAALQLRNDVALARLRATAEARR